MKMRTIDALLILLIAVSSVVLTSCNNDSPTDTNSGLSNLTLAFSQTGTIDSVSCGSLLTKTDVLGSIDLTGSDTLDIRFNFSQHNSAMSEFIIYYEDSLGIHEIANYQYTKKDGDYFEYGYVPGVNVNKVFKYTISMVSSGSQCYFVVKNLDIYKN